MMSCTVVAGSRISDPCPGAMTTTGGSSARSRRRLARYRAMSPSGGAMTTVDPCMTWSPEKSMPSSTSSQHRWFEACPGVCKARSVKPVPVQLESLTHLPGGDEAVPSAEAEHLGAGPGGQGGGSRGVVGVRVGDHHPPDAPRSQLDQGLHVPAVVGAGVDDSHLVGPHQVGVGARGRSSRPGWGP